MEAVVVVLADVPRRADVRPIVGEGHAAMHAGGGVRPYGGESGGTFQEGVEGGEALHREAGPGGEALAPAGVEMAGEKAPGAEGGIGIERAIGLPGTIGLRPPHAVPSPGAAGLPGDACAGNLSAGFELAAEGGERPAEERGRPGADGIGLPGKPVGGEGEKGGERSGGDGAEAVHEGKLLGRQDVAVHCAVIADGGGLVVAY